jgi:hypothetical protein
MNFATVFTSRISPRTLAATMVLAMPMLAGAPVVQAAKTDTGICQDLEGAARGLCRAAIRSGCGPDGEHQQSIACAKLASSYRDATDGEQAVWLVSNEEETVLLP